MSEEKMTPIEELKADFKALNRRIEALESAQAGAGKERGRCSGFRCPCGCVYGFIGNEFAGRIRCAKHNDKLEIESAPKEETTLANKLAEIAYKNPENYQDWEAVARYVSKAIEQAKVEERERIRGKFRAIHSGRTAYLSLSAVESLLFDEVNNG